MPSHFPSTTGAVEGGMWGLNPLKTPRVFSFAKLVRDRVPFVITIPHHATGLSLYGCKRAEFYKAAPRHEGVVQADEESPDSPPVTHKKRES